ncbi:MAG: decarboxylating 6-phosphogluconate dehydrogenase [Pseudomonadota bacterium]|nr:decarboxylating 6-phosphogluconate dehydrogenase [Pseudomonadota bacterium]
MIIGFAGLGRMGANMVRRLRRANVDVVAWNRHFEVTQNLAAETGAIAKKDLESLVAALTEPRIVWLMLPAGEATESAVSNFQQLLSPGDILVNGANENFHADLDYASRLATRNIDFIDAGVSGGIWGLENGYAMMLGGDKASISRLEPLIRILAPGPDKGWVHCGPVGSGHYAKMVHNGIEYGMMQSIAEGLSLLKSKESFNYDLAAITESWRYGSVIRSWLMDLTAEFLASDSDLADIEPFVSDSGEGRWTAIEAIQQGVPTPVMSLALMMRFTTQGNNDYAARLLAMMRKGFGGHAVKEES